MSAHSRLIINTPDQQLWVAGVDELGRVKLGMSVGEPYGHGGTSTMFLLNLAESERLIRAMDAARADAVVARAAARREARAQAREARKRG